jgi:hypothetical protein
MHCFLFNTFHLHYCHQFFFKPTPMVDFSKELKTFLYSLIILNLVQTSQKTMANCSDDHHVLTTYLCITMQKLFQ